MFGSKVAVSPAVALRTYSVHCIYLFRDGVLEPLPGDYETFAAADWQRESLAAYFPECHYVVRPALRYLN